MISHKSTIISIITENASLLLAFKPLIWLQNMSSKVINKNEGINFKSGYLDVKLPLNLGAFVGQYKFWSKKWVQFKCKNSENEDNFVDILIFRNQKSENFIYQKSFQSRNTAIFRSRWVSELWNTLTFV